MAGELQGIQGLSPALKGFVPVVRQFLRDEPELNRLIAGVESGDRFIAWSILDAVAWFNGVPHLTNLTLDDLLLRQQHWLILRMTSITILESVGHLQTRNHLNYSNGGINVGVNDKTPMIMNWLQYYRSFIDQRLQQVKVALNIEGILGSGNPGVHSELLTVNQSYLAF